MVNGRRVAKVENYFDPEEEYCIALGADGRETAYDVDVDYFCLETQVSE